MKLATKRNQNIQNIHLSHSVGEVSPSALFGLCPNTRLPPHIPSFYKNAAVWLFLLLGTLFIATGCFGNKAPARSYFTLDYPLGSQPKYDKPRHQKSIVVSSLTTVNAYDRQEIVFRTNPYEFQYYWYRLWASKPRKMLRELIAQHLRYTQIANNVSLVVEDKLPDFTLETEIVAIEELDVSKAEWYAHLAMRMTLLRFETGMAVWSHEFDVKYPVSAQDPVFVVKAMSELVNAELTKAFLSMDTRLAEVEAEISAASTEENIKAVGDDGAVDLAPVETPVVPTLEAPPALEAPPTLAEQVTDPSIKVEAEGAQIKADTPRATLKNSR